MRKQISSAIMIIAIVPRDAIVQIYLGTTKQ